MRNKKEVRWIHNNVIYTIKKSDKKDKKLVASYEEGGKVKKIHFGATGYSHYFDKTGILPKELNHGDKERRRLYRARHEPITDFNKPSAGLLSWSLLW